MYRLMEKKTRCIYLCKTVTVKLYVVTPQDFTCGGFVLVQLSSLCSQVLGASWYPSKPSLKIVSSELLLTLEDLWMLLHLVLARRMNYRHHSCLLTSHEACLLTPIYTNCICKD